MCQNNTHNETSTPEEREKNLHQSKFLAPVLYRRTQPQIFWLQIQLLCSSGAWLRCKLSAPSEKNNVVWMFCPKLELWEKTWAFLKKEIQWDWWKECLALVTPLPVSPRVPPCCTGYRLAPHSLCLPEGNPGASSMCWLPHPPTEGGPAPGLTPLQRQRDRRRKVVGGWEKRERRERKYVCQWRVETEQRLLWPRSHTQTPFISCSPSWKY